MNAAAELEKTMEKNYMKKKNDQTYIAHAFIVRMFFSSGFGLKRFSSSFFRFNFFYFTEKI